METKDEGGEKYKKKKNNKNKIKQLQKKECRSEMVDVESHEESQSPLNRFVVSFDAWRKSCQHLSPRIKRHASNTSAP